MLELVELVLKVEELVLVVGCRSGRFRTRRSWSRRLVRSGVGWSRFRCRCWSRRYSNWSSATGVGIAGVGVGVGVVL